MMEKVAVKKRGRIFAACCPNTLMHDVGDSKIFIK